MLLLDESHTTSQELVLRDSYVSYLVDILHSGEEFLVGTISNDGARSNRPSISGIQWGIENCAGVKQQDCLISCPNLALRRAIQ